MTRYRDLTGIDLTEVPGTGATGGLAGGLVALGGRIAHGFELVAALTGLADRMAGADLVATGEGHLDTPSLKGKVPGGVLALARAAIPNGPGLDRTLVVCIVGDTDPALLSDPPTGMEIVSLAARFGDQRSRDETVALIESVTAEVLTRVPARRDD